MYKEGTRVRTATRPAVTRLTTAGTHSEHVFEEWLDKSVVRHFLRWLTTGPNGRTPFETICYTYRNPAASLSTRLKYWPVHRAIDYFVAKTKTPFETAAEQVFHHEVTVRSLLNTARSIGVYGLVAPQRFVAPLLVVWNITSRCNLSCRHCYQNASRSRHPDELTREEKLDVVDQLSDNGVAVVSLAGGEPLLDPDVWVVLERAKQRRVHVTIATNGTSLTPANVRRLASLGVKYVEVSVRVYSRHHAGESARIELRRDLEVLPRTSHERPRRPRRSLRSLRLSDCLRGLSREGIELHGRHPGRRPGLPIQPAHVGRD